MATLASQQDAQHHSDTQKMVLQRILFCPSEERTARELHALHPAKREQVWADMSGHKATIEYRLQAESPALLQDRLLKLQMVLKNLEEAYQMAHPDDKTMTRGAPSAVSFGHVDGREAYHVARQQDASWVQAQHLTFLRCEDFDVDAAAHRMMRYFAMKAYLFDCDAEIWGRDLRLSDLSHDDLESLRGGGVQCLSESDHAGRGIIFTRTRNYVYKDRKNLLRAYFFTAQQAIQEEHYQKVGFISISYNVGGYPEGGYDYELTRQVSQLVKACPLRFSGIYLCLDSMQWKPVADLISHVLTPLLRVRLRSIPGSHQECLYQLFALGIPIRAIPVTEEGENMLENHHAWMIRQVEDEEEEQASETSYESPPLPLSERIQTVESDDGDAMELSLIE